MKRKNLLALGFIAPIIFLTCVTAAVLKFTGYDFSENYISDLGARESSGAIFRAGIAACGIMGILFAFGLLGKLKSKSGPAFLMISSAALIGLAIFSARLPAPEIYFGFETNYGFEHLLLGAIFFMFQSLANLVIGFELRKEEGYLIMFSSAIGILFFVSLLPVVEHLAVIVFSVATLLTAFRACDIKLVQYI